MIIWWKGAHIPVISGNEFPTNGSITLPALSCEIISITYGLTMVTNTIDVHAISVIKSGSCVGFDCKWSSNCQFDPKIMALTH